MSAKMTISMIFLLCLVIFQTIQLNEVQSFRFPIHNVTSCPRNDIEWRKASDRLNCSLHFNKKVFRYHCLPDSKLTTLVEFCYDQLRPLVEKGNCVVLDGFNTLLDNYNCSEFKDGCPDKHYDSDAILKYPSCLKINTKNRCFIAEKKCSPFSGLDITEKSTLTRSASQRKEDTEIDKLCQAAIVVSTLILTISAIGLFIYIKHRRKTLPFRCIRNAENEENDENDPLIVYRESETSVRGRIYQGHLEFKDTTDGNLRVPYGENICMTITVVERNKQEGNTEKKSNLKWEIKRDKENNKDKEETRLRILNDPPIYTLTIERARKYDKGKYNLVLMNGSVEKQMATFRLDVLGFKPFVKILGGSFLHMGNTASFVVLQSSYPEAFSSKWYKVTLKPGCDVEETKERIDINSNKYEGSTFDFLVINNLSSEDQGRYVVEVKNIIGEGKGKIDLTVKKKKDNGNETDDSHLKNEGKEKAKGKTQKGRIEIKGEKDIISVAYVRRVYHISSAGSGSFWISDGGRLMKIDSQGFLIQLEDVGRFNTGCHSVTKSGELLYLKDENVYKCNESKAMIDRKKAENDAHDWMAWCIHCSSDNYILVGLIEKKGNRGKIQRYNEKGEISSVLGEDFLNKPLYITENKNKVIVSDAGHRAVIGIDGNGSKRFYYDGNSPTNFFPTGVCTDEGGSILVCIYENNESNVHLLDENGCFVKKMLANEDCVGGPCALCIIGNNLYLGQESCQDIQVYKIDKFSSEKNLHEKD